MPLLKYTITLSSILLCCLQTTRTKDQNAAEDIKQILSPCRKSSPQFDECIKQALNKLRKYFHEGVPELGVAPLDTLFVPEVTQTRSLLGFELKVMMSNIRERGWATATFTKYRTDWDNNQIIFSQHFPVKFLEGDYEMKVDKYGLQVQRSGRWNLTLRDYSQTICVQRRGAGADVDTRLQIDRVGDMDVHFDNLFLGNELLEMKLDRFLNASWMSTLVVVRSLVNDMASTALTYAFTKSFSNLALEEFIPD